MCSGWVEAVFLGVDSPVRRNGKSHATIVVVAWYIRGMKRRLSASIDEELLAAAEAAVREGQAPSMSALVEEALRLQVEKSRRLAAMGAFIATLDEERGRPADDEVDRVMREWRAESVAAAEPAAPSEPAHPLSDAA